MTGKLRILIVDDNQDAADGVAKLLSTLGHETLATYDALEALVEATNFGPDVVILDIGMPGFDGYDLVKELPKRQPRAALVALTGLPVADVQQHGGFDHILTKPADAATLTGVLAQIGSRTNSGDNAHQ